MLTLALPLAFTSSCTCSSSSSWNCAIYGLVRVAHPPCTDAQPTHVCVSSQPRPSPLHVRLQKVHLLPVSEPPEVGAAAQYKGTTAQGRFQQVHTDVEKTSSVIA